MTNVLTPARVKAAIEWRKQELEYLDWCLGKKFPGTDIKDLKERMEQLRTILAALDAVQWRDPEVELPVDGERVIVCTQTKKGVKSINIAYIDADGVWHGMGSMSGVIAWMPLPAVAVWEGEEE